MSTTKTVLRKSKKQKKKIFLEFLGHPVDFSTFGYNIHTFDFIIIISTKIKYLDLFKFVL